MCCNFRGCCFVDSITFCGKFRNYLAKSSPGLAQIALSTMLRPSPSPPPKSCLRSTVDTALQISRQPFVEARFGAPHLNLPPSELDKGELRSRALMQGRPVGSVEVQLRCSHFSPGGRFEAAILRERRGDIAPATWPHVPTPALRAAANKDHEASRGPKAPGRPVRCV